MQTVLGPVHTAQDMPLCEAHLDPGDADAVDTFLAMVRQTLARQGEGTIRVVLVRRGGAGDSDT